MNKFNNTKFVIWYDMIMRFQKNRFVEIKYDCVFSTNLNKNKLHI